MKTKEELIEEYEEAIRELRVSLEERQQWCEQHVGKILEITRGVYFIGVKHEPSEEVLRGFYVMNNFNDSKSIQFGKVNLISKKYKIVDKEVVFSALKDIEEMISVIKGLYIFEDKEHGTDTN